MQHSVLTYYRRLGERDRLRAGATGPLEFLRTLDILTRELPPAPARIIDGGGATGGYAGPLAERGYRVHVVDPVAEQVAEAAARPGVTAAVGDARALDLPDGQADVVLLFGPLYHLPHRPDRIRAWSEAARVVRPGGVVLAATIARYAAAFDGFVKGFYTEPGYAEVVDTALRTGVHAPAGRDWFTDAYFHRPDEPAAEAAQAGLGAVRTVAVEGPLWLVGRLPEILADEAETAHLLAVLRHVEADPAVLATSSHLITVARRSRPVDG